MAFCLNRGRNREREKALGMLQNSVFVFTCFVLFCFTCREFEVWLEGIPSVSLFSNSTASNTLNLHDSEIQYFLVHALTMIKKFFFLVMKAGTHTIEGRVITSISTNARV